MLSFKKHRRTGFARLLVLPLRGRRLREASKQRGLIKSYTRIHPNIAKITD
jgi:hypothetical protein